MIRKTARLLARRGLLGREAKRRATQTEAPATASKIAVQHPQTGVSPDALLAQLEAAEERLKREIPPRED